MSFFLAVDAGGTKTDYVLADETRELARVRTGTIKRMRVDAATACRNLESALAELSCADWYFHEVGDPHLRGNCGRDCSTGEGLAAGLDHRQGWRRTAHSWVTWRSHSMRLFRVKPECWCSQAPDRTWWAAPVRGS